MFRKTISDILYVLFEFFVSTIYLWSVVLLLFLILLLRW